MTKTKKKFRPVLDAGEALAAYLSQLDLNPDQQRVSVVLLEHWERCKRRADLC